jgi:hypothetical protein
MGKRYFVQISTDPDVDPRKCAVGMACAAQAVADGHFVPVILCFPRGEAPASRVH